MQWTDIVIEVPRGQLEEAQAVATLVSPGGIYTEDYSDLEQGAREIAHIDLIDEDLLKKDREHGRIHVYVSQERPAGEVLSFLRGALAGLDFTLSTGSLQEEDWANAWRQYYQPLSLSERLAICPSWQAYTPLPGQQVVRLDPGMAFGTGTHETTRLCLLLLEKYLPAGGRVLDIGCGSGILAIAARLLGAGEVTATDIDPLAVKVAGENAALNGIDDIAFGCFDLAGQVGGPFGLITANIVADTIIRLAPQAARLLAGDGVFITSGIIEPRRPEVLQALEEAGFALLEESAQGGWVAMAWRRAR